MNHSIVRREMARGTVGQERVIAESAYDLSGDDVTLDGFFAGFSLDFQLSRCDVTSDEGGRRDERRSLPGLERMP